jgi:CBS domain-containing protein
MAFTRAGQLARSTPTVRLDDPLGLVAANLRESPCGAVVVLDRLVLDDPSGAPGAGQARILGVIDDHDLARAVLPVLEEQETARMAALELVAVENLVFADAWRAAGNAERPTFHGVPYDSMRDDPATPTDEAHMFEPHFDRHVWIYRDNPNGVFAPFNPSVTCEHHRGPRSHHAAHAAHGE